MSNSSFVSLASLKMILLEQAVTLWRHKWIALAAAWLVCLVGWSAVMKIPRRYESDARAFVDVNGLLTPLLKGLVVDTNASQTNDYVRQTLLSRPNLEQVTHLAQLDNGLNNAEKEALIARLGSVVQVKAQGRNLFTISYVNDDPVEAKNVVESLLTIFAEKAASSSRVEMEKAHKFLDEQIAAYEVQLRAAEQRRADFHKKYAEYFGNPISGTPRLQALLQQVQEARLAYNQASVTRDSLAGQLKQVPEFISADSAPTMTLGADGKIIAGPAAARLAQAKAALAMLRLRLTDQHPDVIAAQNEVAYYQGQVDTPAPAQATASAPASGESSPSNATVPNPTYNQIRLKLVDAQTVIPAAQQRLDQATAEFKKAQAISADVPDVDAKAKDLDRDYDVIKKNHEELVARRESANLSQAADDQADRTQFRIVDPPQVPLNPSFPNLPLMFSLVLVVSIGAGVTIPILYELIRATFSSTERLRSLGLPVMGAVSYVRRPGTTRGFIAGAAGVLVSATALFAVYGALMVISTGAYRGIL